MKAFVGLVCLIAVVVAESSTPVTTTKKSTRQPNVTTTTQRPTKPTVVPTTTLAHPISSAAPSTEPPVDCDISVGENDWAVLLPNPEECESYYVCDAGVPILMPCPGGLHFNPVLSVCDWPAEANCTVSVSESPLN